MKTKLEVEITGLDADDRFFWFDYVIRVKGEIEEEGRYESDYENGNTREEQIAMLKSNYEAEKMALSQAFS